MLVHGASREPAGCIPSVNVCLTGMNSQGGNYLNISAFNDRSRRRPSTVSVARR
jgi:hypothetical protein